MSERILWLHGGNVAGWMWGQQLPAFDDYDNIVPDLPGFGTNNNLPWVSVSAASDWVAQKLDGRPAHVVGLSLGSSVALELAARHPHLVSSLFLASAQLAPVSAVERAVGGVMLAFWNRHGFWTTLARSYGLTGDAATEFIDTGLGIERRTAVRIFDEVSRGMDPAVLARVTAPTIAVAGEKDSPTVSRESLRMLQHGIRGSIAALAPGMHHQWNIEDVQLFNGSLREWLAHRKAAVSLGTRI